jgi:exocyst complex component 2
MHKEKEEKDANDSVLEDPLGIIPNIPKSRFKTLKVSTPFQDDFIAAKYIATFHATTGYEALLGKARKSVQERLVQQKKASKYFIKSNVGKFVSTKDTLEEIFDSSDSLPTKSDWVDRLNFTYRDLQRMGSILFQPMMLTMKKGKELQSMANLVDRLRFIFNIPTDISDGIEKEEYKRVVHEYKKAKLIMSESKQQIFVNMFHKIKQQVVVVVDKLFKMLKDATLSYDEKQRIIRYEYSIFLTIVIW